MCIAALSKGEFRKVVEPSSARGMLRSKCFHNDGEGPVPERLGLLIESLFIREPCQQIEVVGNEGMSRLQDSFTARQRLLE